MINFSKKINVFPLLEHMEIHPTKREQEKSTCVGWTTREIYTCWVKMGSKVRADWICRLLYVNDVRYFPKGFFPSGNFPRVFFQVETSQMWNFPSGNFPSLSQPQRSALKPILVVALGPHCSLQRLRGPNLTFGNLPLGKLDIWEIAACEIVTRKIAFVKIPKQVGTPPLTIVSVEVDISIYCWRRLKDSYL